MSQAELKLFELLGNKEYKLEILCKMYKLNEIEKQIILEEDLVITPYFDLEGASRIGVYHKSENQENASKCTLDEAIEWLKKDIAETVQLCVKTFNNFRNLSGLRQSALLHLVFILREETVKIHGFVDFINEEKFPHATVQMLSTKWYFKVKNKAVNIAKKLIKEC